MRKRKCSNYQPLVAIRPAWLLLLRLLDRSTAKRQSDVHFRAVSGVTGVLQFIRPFVSLTNTARRTKCTHSRTFVRCTTVIICTADIECTENTCYAAVTTVGGGGGGATTHEHSNQQLEDSTSSPDDQHDYDIPLEAITIP